MKYLIEGSCDGDLFAETIEADSLEEAERMAVERLCEAWGEEYGPDTTLDDLGDCATVRAYEPADYARAAAPELLASLKWAVGMAEEAIMVREAGDDEADTPDIIAMHREELEKARDAIAKARGEG